MATAEELLATVGNEENYIVIDSDLRTMTFPASVKNIGVENDKDVHKLNFMMPRYFSEYDLSTFNIRINYLNAQGDGDMYVVTDPTVEEDAIYFSWIVGRHACLYRGAVTFIVCLKLADGEGDVAQEFNTTLASLQVLPGLETEPTILENDYDIIEQLLLTVQDTNVKIKAVLDSGLTPEEITNFVTESKTLSARMDEFTKLPDGSTTGDAELTDIRIGADGTTYETAGKAVRTQIADVKSDLVDLVDNSVSRTRNLINTTNNKVGYIFNTSSSAYVASENWISTDYITVEAGGVYTFTYGNGIGYTMSQCYVLDSDKKYIGAATKSGRTITVPAELTGAAYLVLCANNATAKENADTWMLVNGTDTDYNYTPYYQPVYKSAIVQTTGAETDKIMSQKAVTDAVNNVSSVVGAVSALASSAYSKAEQALESGGGFANLRYPYKVQIPTYFVDDTTNKTLYLSDKINKIKGYNADLNFVFITDLHWNLNQKKSLQLIGYIAQCIKTDAIVNGGDNIGNASDMPTVAIAEYYSRQCQDAFTDVVEKDNWMYVFGNHDLNMANAGSLTDEQRTARRLSFDFVYNTYIAPWAENKVFESVSTESELYWFSKMHYYSDDISKGVRYIVINTGTPYNPYASQVGELGAEQYGQMDWLYNTLMSTPAGYHVIVLGHQFYSANFAVFTGGASWIARMLRAAALKISVSLTATYLGASFARTYDFSTGNNIEVIGMFCGHEHGDKSAIWSGSSWNSYTMDATDCTNNGDVLVICTDSDANEATHNDPEIDRTTGTIGEQCFDVFSVDFSNKKIYATRIGSGSDRVFTFA